MVKHLSNISKILAKSEVQPKWPNSIPNPYFHSYSFFLFPPWEKANNFSNTRVCLSPPVPSLWNFRVWWFCQFSEINLRSLCYNKNTYWAKVVLGDLDWVTLVKSTSLTLTSHPQNKGFNRLSLNSFSQP